MRTHKVCSDYADRGARRGSGGSWLLAALIWLSATGAAQAWTETQVTSVSARVDARQARARVELTLGLQVREGWLSRFELLDLGPELALDEPPACSFQGIDGTDYEALVQITPGSGLSVHFPDKRSAPKRGDYSLRLTWLSRLPGSDAAEQHWALPRWPERVANVRVDVIAPRGATPSPARSRSHDAAEVREAPELQASVLSFLRAELPRTARFEVAWSLPAVASRQAPSTPAVWRALAQPPLAWWLGACLAALWLLKWTLYTREPTPAATGDVSRRHQLLAIEPETWRRALASALGCGLAVALFDAMPLVSAALGVASSLLAVDLATTRKQQPPASAPGADGSEQPRSLIDRAGCAFLDATTPIGASTALLVFGALCWLQPLAPLNVACSGCLAATLFLGQRSAAAAPSRSSSTWRKR